MKPKRPDGVVGGESLKPVNWAEEQPEYQTLPSLVTPQGVVITEFELTDEEVAQIVARKSVFLLIWTFNRGLTPVLPLAYPPTPEDYLI